MHIHAKYLPKLDIYLPYVHKIMAMSNKKQATKLEHLLPYIHKIMAMSNKKLAMFVVNQPAEI